MIRLRGGARKTRDCRDSNLKWRFAMVQTRFDRWKGHLADRARLLDEGLVGVLENQKGSGSRIYEVAGMPPWTNPPLNEIRRSCRLHRIQDVIAGSAEGGAPSAVKLGEFFAPGDSYLIANGDFRRWARKILCSYAKVRGEIPPASQNFGQAWES